MEMTEKRTHARGLFALFGLCCLLFGDRRYLIFRGGGRGVAGRSQERSTGEGRVFLLVLFDGDGGFGRVGGPPFFFS